MTPPRRATAAQLYNAGLAMNLAAGTPEHGARAGQFLALFDTARPWTRFAAAARIAWWRNSPGGRQMRGATR